MHLLHPVFIFFFQFFALTPSSETLEASLIVNYKFKTAISKFHLLHRDISPYYISLYTAPFQILTSHTSSPLHDKA
jgi:hypothetical protein